MSDDSFVFYFCSTDYFDKIVFFISRIYIREFSDSIDTLVLCDKLFSQQLMLVPFSFFSSSFFLFTKCILCVFVSVQEFKSMYV